MNVRLQKQTRRGLTLIELVIVLVILAATAALVIPRLSFLKGQADNAQAAAGAVDVGANIEQYNATVGRYPLRMDSLLIGTGAAAPSGVYDKFWSHTGTPAAPTWLVLDDLSTGSHGTSLGHAGISSLSDHNSASTDPSNSATFERSTSSTGGFKHVARVDVTTSTGASIMNAAGYPNGLPADVKLVAFGIGPRCGAIGTTMTNAPLNSISAANEYGRFIAIFALYDSTSSSKGAKLRTVVDSRGTTVSTRLSNYKNAAPVQE